MQHCLEGRLQKCGDHELMIGQFSGCRRCDAPAGLQLAVKLPNSKLTASSSITAACWVFEKQTQPRALRELTSYPPAAIFNQLVMCSTAANCCFFIRSLGSKILLHFATNCSSDQILSLSKKIIRTQFASWDHPAFCFPSTEKKRLFFPSLPWRQSPRQVQSRGTEVRVQPSAPNVHFPSHWMSRTL